jgi:integrase/recombinase XerD
LALQLYCKIDEEYKEVSALAVGANFQAVLKTPLYISIGYYLNNVSIKKSKCTRVNERTCFSNLYEFLTKEGIFYTNEITLELLQNYKERLLLAGLKASTVNRQFNSIKNFFSVLMKKKMIVSNPAMEISHDEIDLPKIHLWSLADLELARIGLDLHTANLFEFIRLTGSRPIEAVNLIWPDVDQENGFIILRSQKNAERFRRFPISNNVSKLLHNVESKGLYVFGGGSKFTSDSLGKKVRVSVKENCLNKNLTVYGLRHTFCKDLLKSGKSRPLVQRMMGHKDWRTTENYVHWEMSDLQNALNDIR